MYNLVKPLLIIGLLALTAAGCAKIQSENQTPTIDDQPHMVAPKTQTYQNGTYKFRFDYPSEFQNTSIEGYSNLETQVTQVGISQETYPNTNFNDASFSVSIQTAKNLDECLILNIPEGADSLKTKTVINGETFYGATAVGAAAGNRYDSKTYRTFKNNQCYELNETIHTGEISNYEPTVKEINKNEIWQKLDAVTQSFSFTK